MADSNSSTNKVRDDEQYYVISVAAELTGMHAQTLRTYDRLGLVSPMRTRGGGRRYSARDIELLRRVQYLSQEDGVNLAGIKTIIELTEQIEVLEEELQAERAAASELRSQLSTRRRGAELVHVPRSTTVVAWEPFASRRSRNR